MCAACSTCVGEKCIGILSGNLEELEPAGTSRR